MSWWIAASLFVALPAVTLVLTLFNLLVWPRGDGTPAPTTRGVSVLIPARDEEETIERCVRSVLDSSVDVEEVIVYDDRSTDRTPAILERLADESEKVRVLRGGGLPAGWVGKPHACRELAEASGGELLVYLDADTVLEAGGLGRLIGLLEEGPAGAADLVTAVPRQEMKTFGEGLVVPMLHLTYTSWLPLPLVWRSSDPRLLAANGQVVAMRREALASVGGFERVRADVVDDMALARGFKEEGRPVVFADGFRIARCRMYDSWREVWEGFSKNLYEGIGESAVALAGVVALYALAFVVPWVAAPAALGVGASSMAGWAAVGVGCNLAARGVSAWRFRHPVWSVPLHPIGVVALIAIAVNSYRWHRRGEITWAGRSYSARSDR